MIEFYPVFVDYEMNVVCKIASAKELLDKQKITEQLKLFMVEYFSQAAQVE